MESRVSGPTPVVALPPPLNDPLRAIRKFYGWLAVFQILLAAGLIALLLSGKSKPTGALEHV
jgi:hypothetical protein